VPRVYHFGVSNLEKHPVEVIETDDDDGNGNAVEILEPREVPLGGVRAMTVRRTLPQRTRSLVGAWCFVDHYGPNDVSRGDGMLVPPHPHTGLQTVSWLFAGEIEHRDSAGSHAVVRPGELNLMTAGSGIQHSEVSTGTSPTLHGAQLWVALPDATRNQQPFFEHYAPQPVRFGDATLRVFIGALADEVSTASTFTGLVGAQIDLPAGTSIELPVNPDFEHGVLLDAGDLTLEDEPVAVAHLGFLGTGHSTIRLRAGERAVRALLIGGVPLGERIVMWWNFIGRSHEEIVRFREEWQSQVIERGDADGRFGAVSGYDGRALPAPELPTVRLKPRN
jgi:redox-sensitive bicupin YhaK (pirin superfamily)